MRKLFPAVAAISVISLVAACAPNPNLTSEPSSEEQASASSSPSESAQPIACLSNAQDLSLEEQVGQLYMVGVSTKGVSDSVAKIIQDSGVGSVLLLEESNAGAETISYRTRQIKALGSTELPILIAVDQEGGKVQRLNGEGYSKIPTAVEQGELAPSELTSSASDWAVELASSGVRLNLAPVGDVVPEAKVATNEPIGKLQRYYSTNPDEAATSVSAFITGMRTGGVATSVKHFPGLGQVTTNTDEAAATDDVTVVDDPNWAPFEAAIEQDVSSVMVSSAIYTKIDPDVQAVFSAKIITEILRGDLGYDKVVISDDLGVAGALDEVPAKERGTKFLVAGGDLVINADPEVLQDMIDHTIATAKDDPAFADQIERSTARVLELKSETELVDCGI